MGNGHLAALTWAGPGAGGRRRGGRDVAGSASPRRAPPSSAGTPRCAVTGGNDPATPGIKDVVPRKAASGDKGRAYGATPPSRPVPGTNPRGRSPGPTLVTGPRDPVLRAANRPGRDGGRHSPAGVHTDMTVDSQETLAFTTPLPVDTFFSNNRQFGGS